VRRDVFARPAGLRQMGRIGAGFYADRHWNLGEGSIHWHAVFAALARLEGNPP